jgi:hypothetical protein
MRPLPFRVWKPRRMVVSTSRSCGCARDFASSAAMVPSTSPASSMNTSSSSASTSGRFFASAVGTGAAICSVLSGALATGWVVLIGCVVRIVCVVLACAFLIAAAESTTVESSPRCSSGVCALS